MNKLDMKIEVVVIPVSDVDRAKKFYGGLGWRLDADFVIGEDFRIVQFTPLGSPCSIHFGKGVTPAAPGSSRLGQRARPDPAPGWPCRHQPGWCPQGPPPDAARLVPAAPFGRPGRKLNRLRLA